MAPITSWVPKPLCQVGHQSLLGWAMQRATSVVSDVAVNAHHHADQIQTAAHALGASYVSVEQPAPLGTAGAVANLAPWLDGRSAVVLNGDTWSPGGLAHLMHEWNGGTVRVLVPGGQFGPRARIAGTLLPPWAVAQLHPEPSGLYEVLWRDAHTNGQLEVIDHGFDMHDCAAPADLLQANLAALAGESWVDETATVTGTAVNSTVAADAWVHGRIERCVVFPGGRVDEHEILADCIRLPGEGIQQTVIAS